MGNENRNEHPVKYWNVQFVPNSVHLFFILWFSPPYNGGCVYWLENCFGDILSICIGNRDTDLGTKKERARSKRFLLILLLELWGSETLAEKPNSEQAAIGRKSR